MQASYEVSLYGSFPHASLDHILQRCALRSSSSKTINWREILFEPIRNASANAPTASGQLMTDSTRRDQVCISCRRDVDPRSEVVWTFYAHSKRPEPSRNDTTVRQAAYMQIVAGDALSFASALGYRRVEEAHKHGYEFESGKLVIHIFKIDRVKNTCSIEAYLSLPVVFSSFQISPETKEIRRASQDEPWQIEVKTIPIRNVAATATPNSANQPDVSAPMPLKEQTDAVLEFKSIMKGHLDLGPLPLIIPPKESLR
ncbi:hypothetical protein BS47DRAFT_402861 [Hydnum rufescens UP504]|uniref:Mediator of RNA polymerase II transcription subunit 18 n=1 Tax=Hydnum rufescens UP504 TaxID=1448309 RepID=A0A9P6BAY8_9AGAM|nr:hypothetical protein BS47DRAFT_402861 [Hydnum rufescens UP504]